MAHILFWKDDLRVVRRPNQAKGKDHGYPSFSPSMISRWSPRLTPGNTATVTPRGTAADRARSCLH